MIDAGDTTTTPAKTLPDRARWSHPLKALIGLILALTVWCSLVLFDDGLIARWSNAHHFAPVSLSLWIITIVSAVLIRRTDVVRHEITTAARAVADDNAVNVDAVADKATEVITAMNAALTNQQQSMASQRLLAGQVQVQATVLRELLALLPTVVEQVHAGASTAAHLDMIRKLADKIPNVEQVLGRAQVTPPQPATARLRIVAQPQRHAN